MKKVIAVFATLCFAPLTLVQAATVPYENSFNSKANGYAITNDAGWSTASAIAVVTNIDYSSSLNTAYMGTPLNQGYTNALAFSDGALSNEIDGTGYSQVSIDAMVLPTFTQEIVTDTAISNSQLSIAFTTNKELAVYHGTLSGVDNGPNADGQTWTILSGLPPVVSGKWVRVSLEINYASTDNQGVAVMFRVKVDGITATNSAGYPGSDTSTGPTGGSWFLAANPGSPKQLNRIVLSGSGMIDDITVTNSSIPTYVTTSHQIPYNWFLVTGVTNDSSSSAMAAAEADSADADADGMPNWAEYFAGTEPTNSTSKLIIVSQTISNGVPIIQWLGSANALADYTIAASTNLTNPSGWTNLAMSAKTGGTNTYVLTGAPAVSPGFFRVSVVK